MKFVVYKYPLNEDTIVEMPEGSHVLDAQFQKDGLMLWACCPVGAPPVKRHFRVVGTGEVFDTPRAGVAHVASVQHGLLVYHVFEVYDQ